jgi:hypothetical protein
MPLEGDAEVTARDEVVNGLAEHACCFTEEDAKRMIDALAHELAEQIRQESSDQWDRGNQDWDTHDAADLIDPLKSKP